MTTIPERTPLRQMILRWLSWSLFLTLWTLALLTPQPVQVADAVLPEETVFPASKLLHVLGYALLAVLTAALPLRGRTRWWFFALLALHAAGTEFGQQFVPPRTGCLRDVGLDHVGIVVGVICTWRCWFGAGS
jgi:VanZ family protein